MESELFQQRRSVFKNFDLTRVLSELLLVAIVALVPFQLFAAERKSGSSPASESVLTGNVMWRFDGNGRFPKIDPPSSWQKDKNILWKTPIEICGYSSPIVVQDKVFVTAEMGSLYCIDLADGKILWHKDLFSPTSKDIPPDLSKRMMRGCGGDSKQSTPTPASNGELVFYLNATGLCACYDLLGNQKWIQIVETAEQEEHFSSSPIFMGDKIILSWGCLLALDAKDGKTLWKAPDALPTHGTPAITKIGGEAVAITPAGDIVRLADGEILSSGLFESTYTTPLIEGNILYLIDAESLALQLPAKAEKGMRLKEIWKTKLRGAYMASPLIHDNLIYTIESQKSLLQTIVAKTGEVTLTTVEYNGATESRKPGIKLEGLAPAKYVYASPVLAGSRVFFFDDAGNTSIIELYPSFHYLPPNKLEDACVGTPFFIRDKIIIRGTKTIYCIGEKHE
jgi:outer membrane protein assembly factor BamB